VHIYVRDPANLSAKTELTVPEFLQMIADRWDGTKTYSLMPFAFLWIDMPEIDRGHGPPLVFEMTCMFDTNPNWTTVPHVPTYVPVRVIADAHEGLYLVNLYGDIFYQVLTQLGLGDLINPTP